MDLFCCKRYLEDFDSIIWPKWAYIHEDDDEEYEGAFGAKDPPRAVYGDKKDDEDTQRILIECKLDRTKLLKDIFDVEWNDAL